MRNNLRIDARRGSWKIGVDTHGGFENQQWLVHSKAAVGGQVLGQISRACIIRRAVTGVSTLYVMQKPNVRRKSKSGFTSDGYFPNRFLRNASKVSTPPQVTLDSRQSCFQYAMESTAALTSLIAGCRDLQLPLHTARELMRFLLVKKILGLQNSFELGPSRKVDQLQHWMLLETDVRKSVEDIVGEVRHSQGRAKDKMTEVDKAEAR